MAKPGMSEKMLDLVAQRFRTLGEPYRLHILQELEAEEKSVSELVAALDGNQPNVSKHLQILFDAGLTGRRREGTSVFYAISDLMVFKLCALVCSSEAEKSRREFEALAGRQGKAMKIKQFEVAGLAQYSYVLSYEGEAVVIGPMRDFDG